MRLRELSMWRPLLAIRARWGRFADGMRVYRRGIVIVRRRFGPDHPLVATFYHNLGGLEHARARYARGQPCARRALAIVTPCRHFERLIDGVQAAARSNPGQAPAAEWHPGGPAVTTSGPTRPSSSPWIFYLCVFSWSRVPRSGSHVQRRSGLQVGRGWTKIRNAKGEQNP